MSGSSFEKRRRKIIQNTGSHSRRSLRKVYAMCARFYAWPCLLCQFVQRLVEIAYLFVIVGAFVYPARHGLPLYNDVSLLYRVAQSVV